jgi:hypothetical protein
VDRRLIYAAILTAAGVGLARTVRGPRIKRGSSRLLVLGDEMAMGICPPIRALGSEIEVKVECLARAGTTIDYYAAGPGAAALDQQLKQQRPTLVLVLLGTNDDRMTGSAIAQRQRPFLDALLSKLGSGGSEVLWIGPPRTPWAPRGIPELVRSALPKSAYFRSDALAIPRGPDGLMPTARGFAGWAGSVWRWIS